MKIVDRFLKAKHWQLFLLTFGIWMILDLITIEAINQPKKSFNALPVLLILMSISFGIYFGWLWAIVIGLQRKVPQNLRIRTHLFKTLIIFISVSFLIQAAITQPPWILGGGKESSLELTTWLLSATFGLFCLLSILYCIYLASKTIKTIELQQEVDFADFSGQFLLIWIYPIGIWFLQPKVNTMANTIPDLEDTHSNSELRTS